MGRNKGESVKNSQKSDISKSEMPLFAVFNYHFKLIIHIPLPHCCYSSNGHSPPPTLPLYPKSVQNLMTDLG